MTFKVLSNGSVTSPAGFLASGMRAGIKKSFRKFDVSLICSEVPAVSAGTFTTNRVKAWPLHHDLRVMNNRFHRVILANSGNANCSNGRSGERAVKISLDLISRKLKIPKRQIFLASTGIIGKPFPIEKFKAAVPQLIEKLSLEGGHDAARGILTTDTHAKEIAVRFTVSGKSVTIAAMGKGAGMVYPKMNASGQNSRHATMLCFITTDAAISKSLLQKAVSFATERTFNKLVIDNDQSTNDMVLALANGLAQNRSISSEDSRFKLFQDALVYVCTWMAKSFARDGEGVTHVCEITVKGARTAEEAQSVCDRIATSMLFKTMLAGSDPNWGRVMACIGASGADFSQELDIAFDGVPILKNGREVGRNKTELRNILKKKEFSLEIDLKRGRFRDRYWTTDLTKFYVWINSTYST